MLIPAYAFAFLSLILAALAALVMWAKQTEGIQPSALGLIAASLISAGAVLVFGPLNRPGGQLPLPLAFLEVASVVINLLASFYFVLFSHGCNQKTRTTAQSGL